MSVPRSHLLEWIDRLGQPRRVERLPRPVVSIGNLPWGGAGKTPFAEAVARRLAATRRVAILSRGYPLSPSTPVVASDWHRRLAGAAVAGDEPTLLAERLPGVAVVVCAERAAAGRAALERLDPAPDLFLLDDGFAHRRLARDLDLLLFPAQDPLGLETSKPTIATFRQPLRAAARADAVIAHGEPAAIEGALRSVGFTGPLFHCRRHAGAARRPDGTVLPADTPVFAVAGLAHNEAFFQTAAAQGLDVVGHLGFRDHESYGERSRERLARLAARAGARALVTTDKDRVKLAEPWAAEHPSLPLASISLIATPEDAFFAWLDSRLALLPASGAR